MLKGEEEEGWKACPQRSGLRGPGPKSWPDEDRYPHGQCLEVNLSLFGGVGNGELRLG